MAVFGGIEAGGTKFVCAIGTGPDDLHRETSIPTTNPKETLRAVADFFRAAGGVDALGVGSFGPVDLRPDSPTWGHITATPKQGWADTDIAGRLRAHLGVAVALDTDVNAAALGESRWGAAQRLRTFVYMTVGTGIGGGAMVEGSLLHGAMHSEMGHIRVPHDRSRDPFAGLCPFHGDCLEGLASGPALEARWGTRPEALPDDHEAWPLQAEYLAYGLADIICVLSPERIIVGGGVMGPEGLLPLVQTRVGDLLNGYVRIPAILENLGDYIVRPGLEERSGVLGAMALAERAYQDRQTADPHT